MLFHTHSRKLALVALLVIMQSAAPVFAQGLGQSGWSTPGQGGGADGGLGQSAWSTPNASAGGSAGLGQSQWTSSGQGGASNTGLGQSAWASGQMSQTSGQLGQSSWSAPAQTQGQLQGSMQPVQNVGQSGWSAPAQKGISVAPRAASQMNTGMSPMDWVNANRAMAANAREQHAQRMNNQSQWSPAGAGSFNSATMAPVSAAQDPSALTGSVSQVDIVGDSSAFQAAGDNSSARVTPRITGNGQGSYQGNTGFGEPVGEAVGEPVGEPVDGAAPSMQEMMAGIMAVPMMMAANAGLIGQGFGRPFGGGFRSYSGGGVAMTPRTMGIGIAGYSIGRMANRVGNQLARQAMRGAR